MCPCRRAQGEPIEVVRRSLNVIMLSSPVSQISLRPSETSGAPHTQVDDVKLGGQRGCGALARLRNGVGRVESSRLPASAEEGLEIARRRSDLRF